MISIRNGIWETNSSSTHALVWNSDIPKHLPAVIDFGMGYFGWKFKYYRTIEEKASYFYTGWCCLENRDIAAEITKLLTPFGIECNFISRPTLDNLFYYVDNGGIDHNNNLKEWINYMREHPDELVNFLCSPDSFVHTGNDNDDRVDEIYKDVNKYEHYYFKGN